MGRVFMSEEKIYIRFNSLEWFKENAFRDHDGDYWETAECRNHFDKTHQSHGEIYSSTSCFEDNCGTVQGTSSSFIGGFSWCSEILPKEENSMYYV